MTDGDTSQDDFTDQLAERVRQARLRQRSHKPVVAPGPDPSREGIVSEADFRARLAEEMKRSDRYDHTFTVLLIRPDSAGKAGMDHLREKLLTLIEPSLVRGCDIIALLETEVAMAVLLPETGVAEAGALVERLRPSFTGLESCGFSLMEYPTNKQEVVALRLRAA